MRKILILFVIIIFAAVGAGVFLYTKKQQPKPITEETCDKMSAVDFPYISLLTSQNKDSCYSYYATVNNKNSSICNKVVNQGFKDVCFASIGSCDSITQSQDLKDRCFNRIAIEKSDTSLCSNITESQSYQKICEAGVASKCETLTTVDERDACYNFIAEAKKDASYCGKIQDDTWDSRGQCYMRLAHLTKNASLCDYFDRDKSYYGGCYNGVAIATNDPKICEKIVDIGSRNSCYLDIARIAPSVSLCNKIKNNTEGKSICYALVARDKKDASLCNKVEDGMYNKICYVNVAVAKEDMSVCDKLIDEDEISECYVGGYVMLALLKKDVGFCDKIDAESEFKNGCYVEVAAAKKDKTICEKIVNGQYAKEAKEKCMAGKSELGNE